MTLRLLRVAAGVVFVVFGVAKFSRHASEVDSFRQYGLPAPDAFVYAIGALEVVAGLMLIAGVLVWVAALTMAGNMTGAIVVSGLGEGEVVPSLTLAPALLAVMLAVLVTERPPWSAAPAVSASGRARRPRSPSAPDRARRP
jgi:putative oxidoreductase